MSEHAAVARGLKAARELEETGAAFDKVRDAILKAIAEAPVSQPDKVLKLHMALSNLSAVRKAMMDVVIDGQMAEHAIAVAGLTRPS